MNPNTYGPVPLARMGAEYESILEALDNNREVMLAHKGMVAAVLTPIKDGQALALFQLTTPEWFEKEILTVEQSEAIAEHQLKIVNFLTEIGADKSTIADAITNENRMMYSRFMATNREQTK